MPPTPDSVIESLALARKGLESESGQWANLLLLSTVVVGIGVAIEVIAFVMEIWEDRRKLKFHDALALTGAIYVAFFIGYEIDAEYNGAIVEGKLRSNNSAAQAELSDKANAATAKAVDLANKVGGFDLVVKQTNDKLDALQANASDQKARSDAIIASLTAKQKEVETTIAAAKNDEMQLAASANTIKELRQTLHVLTTDRVLSEQQTKDLTEAVKPYGGKSFDVSTLLLNEAYQFGKQIGLALQAANLDWKPRPMFPALTMKGVPDIGNEFRSGLIMEACASDKDALDPLAVAIRNELVKDGFTFVGGTYPDADAETKHEDCGRLHIMIGAKY